MSQMTKEQLFAQAMTLQPTEREALAEQLLLSVTHQDQAAVDAAWLAEARRREEAFAEGRMASSTVDDVIARVQARARQ